MGLHVDRAIFLPLYQYVLDEAALVPWEDFVAEAPDDFGNHFVGRVIQFPAESPAEGVISQKVLDCAGPGDIVAVPLWYGWANCPGRATDRERLPTFSENLRKLEQLAEVPIKAAVAGNGGSDMGSTYWMPQGTDLYRSLAIDEAAELAQKIADTIWQTGVRPVINAVCFTLLQAIYCADLATGETLLGVVRRSNAILSDYMMGECWFPYLAPLMQDVEGRFVPVERRDGFPYRKIEAAMKSVECIPALGYRQQLAAGVDGMLMCYGAKAGILADWWR